MAGFYRKMKFEEIGQLFMNDVDIPDRRLRIPIARFSGENINMSADKAQWKLGVKSTGWRSRLCL